MTRPEPLVEVHCFALPVRLAAKSQQHFEELMREFTLIAASAEIDHSDGHVPSRLMQLVNLLVAQYGGLNSAAEQLLADAIDRDDELIEDHVLQVPASAGSASQALSDMIDEADDYCRQGRHLLTLASPPDCVAYRRWYLGEVIRQLDGGAPVPWPDSEQAQSL